MGLDSIGKVLLILAGLLAALGVFLLFVGRLPHFGKLPGDILFQQGNFTFYFPLVTTVLLSLLLTVVINLLLKLFR